MPRILVADDDAVLKRVLVRTLAMRGHDVTAVGEGTAVFDAIRRDQPDLVLLDDQMPGKTGLEVLRELRSDASTRLLPIIIETGAADVVTALGAGADDYLNKPFSMEELVARIEPVLRRCAVNLDANPLTRLPGSGVIDRELRRMIDSGAQFAVLYVDVNQFKPFNDHYGAVRGDDVIRYTADILKEACLGGGDFVGHIGGDDFVVITVRPESDVCEDIIGRFEAGKKRFYDPGDWSAGSITVTDRNGQKRDFPPVTLAIGVATNRRRPLRSVMEISAILAEVKGAAKRQKGSTYFVDRRTDAYGSPRGDFRKI